MSFASEKEIPLTDIETEDIRNDFKRTLKYIGGIVVFLLLLYLFACYSAWDKNSSSLTIIIMAVFGAFVLSIALYVMIRYVRPSWVDLRKGIKIIHTGTITDKSKTESHTGKGVQSISARDLYVFLGNKKLGVDRDLFEKVVPGETIEVHTLPSGSVVSWKSRGFASFEKRANISDPQATTTTTASLSMEDVAVLNKTKRNEAIKTTIFSLIIALPSVGIALILHFMFKRAEVSQIVGMITFPLILLIVLLLISWISFVRKYKRINAVLYNNEKQIISGRISEKKESNIRIYNAFHRPGKPLRPGFYFLLGGVHYEVSAQNYESLRTGEPAFVSVIPSLKMVLNAGKPG